MRRFMSMLLLLILPSCISDRHSVGDLLMPDQFHANYGEGAYEGSGRSGGNHAPWRRFSQNEGDFDAWSVGLSWNLTGPPRDRDMEKVLRQLHITTQLMSDRLQAERAVSVASVVAPAPIVVEVPVQPSSQEPDRTDINITVQGGDQHAAADASISSPESPGTSSNEAEPAGHEGGAEKPQGVELLGISKEVWTQLLIAMSLLATAIAGYLGREKIPVVKELTKKGKADRADKKAAAEAEDGG